MTDFLKWTLMNWQSTRSRINTTVLTAARADLRTCHINNERIASKHTRLPQIHYEIASWTDSVISVIYFWFCYRKCVKITMCSHPRSSCAPRVLSPQGTRWHHQPSLEWLLSWSTTFVLLVRLRKRPVMCGFKWDVNWVKVACVTHHSTLTFTLSWDLVTL